MAAPTVQEKLQSLQESQKRILSQQNATWKEKQNCQKELKNTQQAIANLEKYQQLKVNDWVTNQQQVGEIIQLNLSPGGIPEVWISWDNCVPIPEHVLEKLIVLEPDWNKGFVKGDLVWLKQLKTDQQKGKGLEKNSEQFSQEVSLAAEGMKRQQVATIMKFEWSSEYQCVLPLVQAQETGESKLVLWENLSLREKDKSTNLNVKSKLKSSDSDIKIRIDEEFKSLIPVLTPEEKSQLENNLIREGCRDPIVIWKGYNILLDGHNRYEICLKNGLDYEFIELELPSREEAHLWMMRNQLGRRNLQPEALSYFRGKLQAAVKKKLKNPTGKNQYSEVKCNFCT